jgi:hypothetical protein
VPDASQPILVVAQFSNAPQTALLNSRVFFEQFIQKATKLGFLLLETREEPPDAFCNFQRTWANWTQLDGNSFASFFTRATIRIEMSHYSFPILSEREVAQCLHELGMAATVDQLIKPTYELVQPIYENLVTALTGITR